MKKTLIIGSKENEEAGDVMKNNETAETTMKKTLSKQQLKEKIKTNLFAYSLLAIPLAHFAIFYIYVNLSSFALPFLDENTGAFTWGNFELFFNELALGAESEILQSLKNTLIYFFVDLCMTPLAFILAFFLYKKLLGYKFFRVIFTLPMIISSVVLVAIYKNLLSADGPLDMLVTAITGHPMENYPLYTEGLATLAIVIFKIWTGFGMNMILFSGSMARIPDSVIEYAKIDGCGFTREMFQIVLPIIWPTVSIMMLLSVIGIFNADGPIILFSGGMYGTSTIGYWMYNSVVLSGRYNYAAAFGLILTLATVPIFVLTRWLFRKMPGEVTF